MNRSLKKWLIEIIVFLICFYILFRVTSFLWNAFLPMNLGSNVLNMLNILVMMILLVVALVISRKIVEQIKI